jgi:nitrate/nitrite-specific signal transduction histidine kinase
MFKSLKLRKLKNDTYGLIPTYVHLAEYYKKGDQAGEYLNKAYRLATVNNSPDDRLFVLKYLREYHSGHQRERYSEIYISLNDSIENVRLKAKNQFAKIRYDSKREKETNLKLMADQAEKNLLIERQESRNRLLLIGIILAAVTIITIIIYFTSRVKIQKLKSVYETEIKISERLHDELANDTYHLMLFTNSHDLSDAGNKEILLEKLDMLYSGVRNISRENASIDTGPGFISELKGMISGYESDKTRVAFTGIDEVPWGAIEKQKKITLYRTILELLVNMKKHSNCKRALLQFAVKNKKIEIVYTDDGNQPSKSGFAKKNGLRNVENRIGAIKGAVIFEQTEKRGFKITISIPI